MIVFFLFLATCCFASNDQQIDLAQSGFLNACANDLNSTLESVWQNYHSLQSGKKTDLEYVKCLFGIKMQDAYIQPEINEYDLQDILIDRFDLGFNINTHIKPVFLEVIKQPTLIDDKLLNYLSTNEKLQNIFLKKNKNVAFDVPKKELILRCQWKKGLDVDPEIQYRFLMLYCKSQLLVYKNCQKIVCEIHIPPASIIRLLKLYQDFDVGVPVDMIILTDNKRYFSVDQSDIFATEGEQEKSFGQEFFQLWNNGLRLFEKKKLSGEHVQPENDPQLESISISYPVNGYFSDRYPIIDEFDHIWLLKKKNAQLKVLYSWFSWMPILFLGSQINAVPCKALFYTAYVLSLCGYVKDNSSRDTYELIPLLLALLKYKTAIFSRAGWITSFMIGQLLCGSLVRMGQNSLFKLGIMQVIIFTYSFWKEIQDLCSIDFSYTGQESSILKKCGMYNPFHFDQYTGQ